MTINEYQIEALRTVPNPDGERIEMLENGLIGLCGESGEAIDIFKKYKFHGHELDTNHLKHEIGDVAWYLAVSAAALGVELEEILQMNVNKLRGRYPDGFDSERSMYRAPDDI